MARKYTERYVRFYTVGSTAAKLDREERKAALPQYKTPQKRQPIAIDPIGFVGSAVAVVLAVLMIVGMVQVAFTAGQVRDMQTQVQALEKEQEMLRERYEAGYDLDEVRVAAESMGMVPAEDAVRVSVQVPEVPMEVETLSWWDSLVLSLRQIFA